MKEEESGLWSENVGTHSEDVRRTVDWKLLILGLVECGTIPEEAERETYTQTGRAGEKLTEVEDDR